MKLSKNLGGRVTVMESVLLALIAPAQADIALHGQLELENKTLAEEIDRVEAGDAVLDAAALEALGLKTTKLRALERRLENVNGRIATIDEDEYVEKRIEELKKAKGDAANVAVLALLSEIVEEANSNNADIWVEIGERVQSLYTEACSELRQPHFDRAVEALAPLFLTSAKAREWAPQTDLVRAFYPTERFQSSFGVRSAERAAGVFATLIAGKAPVDFEAQRSAAEAADVVNRAEMARRANAEPEGEASEAEADDAEHEPAEAV